MQSNWIRATLVVVVMLVSFFMYLKVSTVLHFPYATRDTFGGNNTSKTISLPESATVLDRENIYRKRRREVNVGCKKVNMTVTNRSTLNTLNTYNLLFEKKHFIYYCPIHKVGTKFWKRVLLTVASQGRHSSPFTIDEKPKTISQINIFSNNAYRTFQQKGSSFLFVRDPYARLFSGYLNKLYHSNLRAWKLIGKNVVRVIRDSHEHVYTNYGFDVTFSEFIKYLLFEKESEKEINVHFAPMIDHCDPCKINFRYIGKLETIEDDAKYIISQRQRRFNDINIQFDDFGKETTLDTARHRIKQLYETKEIIGEIQFPFIRLMLRTWRDLQMRGFLSKYIEFPFNQSEEDNITAADYIEAIKDALEIPVNVTEVKQQRNEALIFVYRQVSIADMERLRKYVLNDCLLFGYDDRPTQLFDRSKPFEDDFVYLDGLKKN